MQATERDEVVEAFRELTTSYTLMMLRFEQAMQLLGKHFDVDGLDFEPVALSSRISANRVVTDRSTLSVVWRGKSCRLGNTLPFRLAERLIGRPNRYFSYEDLLDDIWGGTRSPAAVRSTVKVLRQRLRESDMHPVANSIDGSNQGHYGMMLDRLK